MTDPADESPPRRAPRLPKRRPFGRVSGEWGLALLALVLAVLVWAIMWGSISQPDSFQDVELHPKTSPRFVAYPEGSGLITLKVRGPRRELEEAQARLGSPASVDMPIADLAGDKDYERVFLTDVRQLTVPFPARLLLSFEEGEVAIEVFRLKESVVEFENPVVDGCPDGVDYAVTLEPKTCPVTGPAHRVGTTIQPDHVEVKRLFPDRSTVFLPAPITEEVSFNNWRSDQDFGRYRTDVELPNVKATIRFFATGERNLENLLVFWGEDGPLEGYEVTVTGAVDATRYTGRFVGAEEALDSIEQNRSSWWFVVRVPRDKLPTGDEPTTSALPVEYVHTSALDLLRAKFEPKEQKTLLVVVKRAP